MLEECKSGDIKTVCLKDSIIGQKNLNEENIQENDDEQSLGNLKKKKHKNVQSRHTTRPGLGNVRRHIPEKLNRYFWSAGDPDGRMCIRQQGVVYK